MKLIIKILILIGIFITFFTFDVNASNINIWNIEWIEKVTQVTIEKTGDSDIVKSVNDFWFNILRIAKIILQWLLVIFIVYTWWKMIMSMWSDDWELKKAKDQLRYAIVAIVFINVPGVIYEAITIWSWEKSIGTAWWDFTNANSRNLFLNMDLFGNWFMSDIISAIEVLIFSISVYVIIMAGIKMLTSRWRDEKVKEAKEKLLYSIFAMIFVGFIEAWKQVVISWKITWAKGSATYLFWKTIDIALLFAGPVAIIFLTYAGYIYITANGEEEKVKKAKNIIINTFIGTILLIIMVTFLNDLLTLT